MNTKVYLKLVVIAFFLISKQNTFAQKKLIKKFFSPNNTTRASTFLPIPLVTYAEETGLAFGVTGLYSFYTDSLDKNNRNSVISAEAEYSTEKQVIVFLKSDIWGINNNYHYVADIRYSYFPFYFYGIGNQTKEINKDLVTQQLRSLSVEVEKKLTPLFYTGIYTTFNHYSYIEKDPQGTFATSNQINSKGGGKAIFIGLSQIIDNRNSNVYPTAGNYLKVQYGYCPNFFAGDSFTGSNIKVDFRSFRSLNTKLVLGANANFQSIQGRYIPFYLLPQLGNDMIMRGYYSGRYRDQNLLAAQLELRYRFIPRAGVTTFIGAGNVYSNGNLRFNENKYSLGIGAQYFFDVERGLSIRADYAIGEKVHGEKRQDNFYITIGQSF